MLQRVGSERPDHRQVLRKVARAAGGGDGAQHEQATISDELIGHE